jgi:hypothetical protein
MQRAVICVGWGRMAAFSGEVSRSPTHIINLPFSSSGPEQDSGHLERRTCWRSTFKYPGVPRRMCRGPLWGEIEGIASDLARNDYSRGSAKRYLSLIGAFSRYASRSWLRPAPVNWATVIEGCLDELPRSSMRRILELAGVTPQPGLRFQPKDRVVQALDIL